MGGVLKTKGDPGDLGALDVVEKERGELRAGVLDPRSTGLTGRAQIARPLHQTLPASAVPSSSSTTAFAPLAVALHGQSSPEAETH